MKSSEIRTSRDVAKLTEKHQEMQVPKKRKDTLLMLKYLLVKKIEKELNRETSSKLRFKQIN